MTPTAIALTDLPSDVLYSIFPYLSAADFLSFTAVTVNLLPFLQLQLLHPADINNQKTLHTYHQDPSFWHALTRTTFRIPDQPLLQGARWQWLYKKLLTQTRLYTWGDNKRGNLGHENPGPQTQRLSPHAAVHGRAWRTEAGSAGWPKQPAVSDDVGIVADVQCGYVRRENSIREKRSCWVRKRMVDHDPQFNRSNLHVWHLRRTQVGRTIRLAETELSTCISDYDKDTI
ncbi:MAG: hypothetical protein Q9175_001454 [Cornicularia normoerica]